MRWFLIAALLLLSIVRSDAQAVFGQVNSYLVANNTTAIVVKAGNGYVTGLEAFNNSTSIAYVKLYDATSATCGTGTPKARYMIPGNSNGNGYITSNVPADGYVNGIVMCVTTGIADNDTGAPSASEYIVNVHWQ